jgi:hypothetical protein
LDLAINSGQLGRAPAASNVDGPLAASPGGIQLGG